MVEDARKDKSTVVELESTSNSNDDTARPRDAVSVTKASLCGRVVPTPLQPECDTKKPLTGSTGAGAELLWNKPTKQYSREEMIGLRYSMFLKEAEEQSGDVE